LKSPRIAKALAKVAENTADPAQADVPIGEGLRGYLSAYNGSGTFPVTYERLRGFTEGIPLSDATGSDALTR